MLLGSASAFAGPFILAGTDADEHGSVVGNANDNGWLFMQRALENMAPAVTNGQKTVVSLGSNPGTQAGNAAASAFNRSNLVSSGWTYINLDSVAAITAFFSGTSTTNSNNTGILMLDSGGNVSGGLSSAEEAALIANASSINAFLGAGGGLFSQANSYGWLSTILPGATATGESSTGITLTSAGSAAFPGLTNADLSSGPYHNRFNNFGAISVLGTGTATGSAIIIGANAGSITDPGTGTPVPEPTTIALVGLGLLGFATARRKSTKGKSA